MKLGKLAGIATLIASFGTAAACASQEDDEPQREGSSFVVCHDSSPKQEVVTCIEAEDISLDTRGNTTPADDAYVAKVADRTYEMPADSCEIVLSPAVEERLDTIEKCWNASAPEKKLTPRL